MNIQEVIAFLLLGGALYFVIRKFIFPTKKKNKKCDTDCGCH